VLGKIFDRYVNGSLKVINQAHQINPTWVNQQTRIYH
jgi:hypothetical protein